MKFKNYDFTLAANLNASANSTSVENLEQDYGFCLQIGFTGSALNGTFKLQASNDSSTWTDVPSSSQSVTALTGASSAMWNIDGAYYNYVRLVWTYTSGSGTISACKMVVKSY